MGLLDGKYSPPPIRRVETVPRLVQDIFQDVGETARDTSTDANVSSEETKQQLASPTDH